MVHKYKYIVWIDELPLNASCPTKDIKEILIYILFNEGSSPWESRLFVEDLLVYFLIESSAVVPDLAQSPGHCWLDTLATRSSRPLVPEVGWPPGHILTSAGSETVGVSRVVVGGRQGPTAEPGHCRDLLWFWDTVTHRPGMRIQLRPSDFPSDSHMDLHQMEVLCNYACNVLFAHLIRQNPHRFLSPLQGLESHDVVLEDATAPVCCKNDS